MDNQQIFLSDEELEEAAGLNDLQEQETGEDDLSDQLPIYNYQQAPDFSEKLLFSWVSPERVFRPRLSKVYLRNIVLILLLIVILLIFTNQFALLVVVLALFFLAYVLANVPPQKVRHNITNYGIYTHNKFYSWLNRGQKFWWEENYGQKQVVAETQIFPYRLIMLSGHIRNEKMIEKVLSHYLVNQTPELSKVDKILIWWKEKFPLD